MTPPAASLDLRGVSCPLNYVKTRVALDRVGPGAVVEVLVDAGEPADNVPRSCEEDGFPVLSITAEGDAVRVRVLNPAHPG